MHSGSTTSSAPWRSESFTSCVASSMLCSMSPRRARVWAAAARKRFFFIGFSLYAAPASGVQWRSIRDLALEHRQAMALERDEARVDHALGVARPGQVDVDEVGHPRRPPG